MSFLSELLQNKKYEYKFTLHKMNFQYIMPLYPIEFSITNNYSTFNEINLTIQKKTTLRSINTNIEKNIIENPAWKIATTGAVVLVKALDGNDVVYEEYFKVSSDDMSLDETTKNLTCQSMTQYVFNHVKLRGYDAIRKLYEYDYNKSYSSGVKFDLKDNTTGGVLNYIIEYCLNNPNYSISDNQWKVTFFDKENLDKTFQNDTVTKNDIDYIKNRIMTYWHWSQTEENWDLFDTDSTDISIKDDSGKEKITFNKWYKEIIEITSTGSGMEEVPSTEQFSDLYMNKVELQKALNQISSDLIEVIDTFRLRNRYEKLINDFYIGTKAFTIAENIVAQMQVFIDSLITENNIAVGVSKYVEDSIHVFEDVTRNLFTPLLIFKGCSGIPPYRNLKIDSSNLVDTFKQIEEAYQCKFFFNNVKKEIQVYARNNPSLNEDTHVLITPKNIITNLQRQDNAEQVITRLYINGKNNTVISGITPMGVRYFDDFTYFKSNKYMSDELINALNVYDSLIADFKEEGSTRNLQEYLISQDQLYESKNYDFLYIYDYYIKWLNADKEYEYIGELIHKAKTQEEKDAYEVERTALEDSIHSYESVMTNTLAYEEKHWCGITYQSEAEAEGYKFVGEGDKWSLLMQKFFDNVHYILIKKTKLQESYQYKNIQYNGNNLFTDELLGELEHFVNEEDLDVNTISDSRALLYYAQNYMQYINKIPTTFTVNAISILDNKKYQTLWQKLTKVGDYIAIDCPELNINKELCKLMSFTHNPVTHEFNLTFTNEDELKDDYNIFINGVVKKALDLSKSADKYQDSWDEYVQKKELYLEEGQNIDAQINSIVAGNKPIISKSGLVISPKAGNGIKQLADGVYCPAGNGGNNTEDGGINNTMFNGESGLSADITVNRLKTDSQRILYYLLSQYENPDYHNKTIDYIDLYEEKLSFITDTITNGTETKAITDVKQLTSDNGATKYYYSIPPDGWGITISSSNETEVKREIAKHLITDTKLMRIKQWVDKDGKIVPEGTTGATINWVIGTPTATDLPKYNVMVFDYFSFIKGGWSFEEYTTALGNKDKIPTIRLGTGSGNGDNGQAIIRKGEDGIEIDYKTRKDGKHNTVLLTDDGIKYKYNDVLMDFVPMKVYASKEDAEKDKTLPLGAVAVIKKG